MTADAPRVAPETSSTACRHRTATRTVPFVVDIPRIAVGGAPRPADALGATASSAPARRSARSSVLANTYDFIVGGVDMQGMSGDDLVPAILPLVQDFSKFHFIPERLHQGFLNHLLMGRLMGDPVAGPELASRLPARRRRGRRHRHHRDLLTSGGSQGGIFGIAIMSIATNFTRGFLAVPAANYSTLLHRSIDFNPYLGLIRGSYPDRPRRAAAGGARPAALGPCRAAGLHEPPGGGGPLDAARCRTRS